MIGTACRTLFELSDQGGDMGGACETYGERQTRAGFWWGKLKGREHLEELRVDGRVLLK